MKKLFLLVTLLAGFGLTLLASETPIQPVGLGTAANPYKITNLANLYWVSLYVDSSAGKYYTLTTNIDAAETMFWPNGFQPIGNKIKGFSGYFIGSNYTISNLYIDRAADSYTGLFAHVKDGVVTGVNLTDCRIQGGNYTGGLIGYNNGGTVTSNYVQGVIQGGDVLHQGSTGGLIGHNNKGSVQINRTDVTVSGYDSVGGVVGLNTSPDTVAAVYSKGSVSGNEKVGGVIGECNASGSVSLAYSHSSVLGKNYVGGVIGYNRSQVVYQTYATGTIISNGKKTGGLMGYSSYDLSGYYSFWDVESTGLKTSYGGAMAIGLPTEYMKKASTYTAYGWDLVNYWKIDENELVITNDGYPYLRVFDTVPPTITKDLENITVMAGSDLDLTIDATGSETMTYEWSKDGAILATTTVPTYSLTNVTLENAGYYSVTVRNSYGAASSRVIYLTVVALPPVITKITEKQYVTCGKTVIFQVTANDDNLTYQWYHNGKLIPFANEDEYEIESVTIEDAGSYSVKVRGNGGTTATAQTSLWIIEPVLKNSIFSINIYGPEDEEFSVYYSNKLKETPQLLFTDTLVESPYIIEDKTTKTTAQRYYSFK